MAKKSAPQKRPPTRTEAKEETRAALVKAGIELIGEEGIEKPSLDAICERAGYTRGAFYVHFEDRDAFLVAVMDEVGKRVLSSIIGDEAEGDDLSTITSRFVAAVASGDYPLTPKGGVKPHQLLAACARSPKIRERYVGLVEESVARFGKFVARAQDDASIRDDVGPRDVATLVLAGIIGAQTMMDLGVPLDLSRLAPAWLTLLARASARKDSDDSDDASRVRKRPRSTAK